MHKAEGASTAVFLLRQFRTEQIFVSVLMQLRNHRHTTSEAFRRCDILSTCVVQSVCVHTMNFVSAHKQINKIKLNIHNIEF